MNTQPGALAKLVLGLRLGILAQETHFMHRIREVIDEMNVSGLGEFGHLSNHLADEKGMREFVQPIPERIQCFSLI